MAACLPVANAENSSAELPLIVDPVSLPSPVLMRPEQTETSIAPTALPPTPVATATEPPPVAPRSHYTLDATLNYELRQLQVTQTVDYLNDTATPLQELVLVVDANQTNNVFFLQNFDTTANGATASATLNGRYLSVTLTETLAVGARVQFSLSYLLALPAEQSSLGYWRQTNMGDWYPYVAAYDAENGWILDYPGQVGEHQTYPIANYDVSLSIENTVDDLVIAASAKPYKQTDGTYFYTHANARNFAFSISPEYATKSVTVDDIIVTSYYYPGYETAGAAALEATANALTLFGETYGAYPHDALDIVIADFGDGLEYDGLYFLGESYYRTYGGNSLGFLTMIAVHETAHQWWYGLVANNQAQDPWLDEAFAIYAEYLYYERFEPDWVDWWWRFRVDRHAATGNVDSTVGQFTNRRPYINAVYLRGVQFLHEVRLSIGAEAFADFSRTYLQTYQGEIVTPDDFWDHLAAYTTEAEISRWQAEYFSSQ